MVTRSRNKGVYTYDFGDSVGMAPVVKMQSIRLEAEAIGQRECFEAAQLFAKTEGIVPAPEATHAIAISIHGHFDMKAF